jgi:hypothetical protein
VARRVAGLVAHGGGVDVSACRDWLVDAILSCLWCVERQLMTQVVVVCLLSTCCTPFTVVLISLS